MIAVVTKTQSILAHGGKIEDDSSGDKDTEDTSSDETEEVDVNVDVEA